MSAIDRVRELFYRLQGRPLQLDLRGLRRVAGEVRAAQAGWREAADGELTAAGRALAGRARAGEALDGLLVEAFALVREAALRVLDLDVHDEQVMAGVVLHGGRVAEMQTGEGKTLAAVFPAFLNGLTGEGVHVLTVNDYLARRDAEWMGGIYRLLGLSVAFVQERMPGPAAGSAPVTVGGGAAERRAAYGADVTYLTARQAGYDALRDDLCVRPEDSLQRGFHFGLFDEVDSILIDEARIPLVIAGSAEETAERVRDAAGRVRGLAAGSDFAVQEHGRAVHLTDAGLDRLETELGVGSLHDPANGDLLAALHQALHAEVLLRRDVDYIVRDGKVEQVDEFTGRVADRRKWPDGLQAAVEAKEGLSIEPEGRILGSVTLLHLARQYRRLAGMTATAQAAAREFAAFYELEVTVLPTHRPCVRADHPDRVFAGREEKENALLAEISEVHGSGRPILVGTASVRESERLAGRLHEADIDCAVLNAKNDEEEAGIVADAGALGAVTISTNMAGRGTDIRLGGREERKADAVRELGGLYVIGTNRHESRRVDDQLRGRAGRQGDPGASRFFLSLDDDLIARFGVRDLVPGAHWRKVERRRRSESGDDSSVAGPERTRPERDDPGLHKAIESAQRIVEGQNLEVRLHLFKYSEIVDLQRQIVQQRRHRVLHENEAWRFLRESEPERSAEVEGHVGPATASGAARQIAVFHLDSAWSRHLVWLSDTKEGVYLYSACGMSPLDAFHRKSTAAFEAMLAGVDDEVRQTFRAVSITERGADLAGAGLRAPAATWTYMVNDHPFEGRLDRMARGVSDFLKRLAGVDADGREDESERSAGPVAG